MLFDSVYPTPFHSFAVNGSLAFSFSLSLSFWFLLLLILDFIQLSCFVWYFCCCCCYCWCCCCVCLCKYLLHTNHPVERLNRYHFTGSLFGTHRPLLCWTHTPTHAHIHARKCVAVKLQPSAFWRWVEMMCPSIRLFFNFNILSTTIKCQN